METGIRVSVAPSQSSYFAGEEFSVKITFTNTHSPLHVQPPSSRGSHVRGTHSISSAPIARPPTSPGMPRAPNSPGTPRTPTQQSRWTATSKGLIGKSKRSRHIPRPAEGVSDELPQLIDERRKRQLGRSLSVTVTPHDIPSHVLSMDSPVESPTFKRLMEDQDVPVSPHRSPTLPANHPHARKHSMLDGEVQAHLAAPLDALNSTHNLSLGAVLEYSPPPYPATPNLASPNPSFEGEGVFPSAPRVRQSHRPTHLGLGRPNGQFEPAPKAVSMAAPDTGQLQVPAPRSAFSSSFPQANTELILYAYAQLSGTLVLEPMPEPGRSTAASRQQDQTLNALRRKLVQRPVVGGGSMDITAGLRGAPPPSRPVPHRRGSSISSTFFSLLSPSPLPLPSPPSMPQSAVIPQEPWGQSPNHLSSSSAAPSPTTTSFPVSSGGVGLGISPRFESNAPTSSLPDYEAPLPTFEVQPAMLAVDLTLGPGEERSYTYTLNIPDNLPPTYKGRSLRFSYELVVGTCRAGSGAGGSVSRIMKVPIRVYNHVVVGRRMKPYDLLWPAGAKRAGGEVVEEFRLLKASSSSSGGTLNELKEYTRKLVPNRDGLLPESTGTTPILGVHQFSIGSPIRPEREEEGSLTGCREAVEILTRIPKKVSYDVNKEGVKVAVLTFTKSAYRLGETVLGVVELNDRSSRARVLQLSAILEAHEALPSSLASSATTQQHMRRIHAEHHSSFVMSTLRTTFALDIPSDASPAFEVVIGDGDETAGGLTWKVRLCLLVAIASVKQGSGGAKGGGGSGMLKHLQRDGPRGEWGSSWTAPEGISPQERKTARETPPPVNGGLSGAAKSWASFFATSLLGASEGGYHDGDEGTDEGGEREDEKEWDEGGDGEWDDVKIETVECEVPIKVWPGNTAFKATDVVFDV